MGRLALCALALLLALAGCARIDAEQVRVCRSILPALNPGAWVSVTGTERGPVPRSVRLNYDVERTDRTSLPRYALCVFAAEGLSPNKAELVGVATETGPIAGANLFFLKRYYLETPEGLAGDPGGAADAVVPEVPRGAAYALQQLLISLPRTAIYALLATAYALVFGLVGRINLAFGELAAVGSAATVAGAAIMLVSGTSAPLLGLGLGLVCALGAGALYSAVGGHFTLVRIRSSSPQPSLIATVGVSLALMEYLRVVQSPVTVWMPPVFSEVVPLVRAGDFIVNLTPITVLTAAIALAAGIGLLGLMQGTAFGRAWRAYADDARAAELFGVDGRRLLLATLALAGAMAGLAGFLIVAQYGGLGFTGGFQYGLKALIAAVVGGIGSVPGALLGGVAVGLFETLWSSYLPIEARDMALYAALVVFLVFRPGGFLGIRDPSPRPV
jgi:branched-subunit amino acid ABC-type transport system permease component